MTTLKVGIASYKQMKEDFDRRGVYGPQDA
jgi:hypothetical protein